MLKNYSPPNSNQCPKCHSDQAPNILVCTLCGYNFRVVLYNGVIDHPESPQHWTKQPFAVTVDKAKDFFRTTGGVLIAVCILASTLGLMLILAYFSLRPTEHDSQTVPDSTQNMRSQPVIESEQNLPPAVPVVNTRRVLPGFNPGAGEDMQGSVKVVLASIHADLMRGEITGTLVNNTSRLYHTCAIGYELCDEKGTPVLRSGTEVYDVQPGSTVEFVIQAKVNYTTYRLAYLKCYQ